MKYPSPLPSVFKKIRNKGGVPSWPDLGRNQTQRGISWIWVDEEQIPATQRIHRPEGPETAFRAKKKGFFGTSILPGSKEWFAVPGSL